jgi:hypothetical protein
MLVHRSLTLAALALTGATLTAAGCGSSPGSVTGSIHGTSLGVNDAVSGIYTSGSSSAAVIALTTETDACATFTSGVSVKNATSLVISLGQIDIASLKTVAPTAPGTFTVWDSKKMAIPPMSDVAVVSWYQSDSNCQSTVQATGATGTVSLTGANNGAFSGSGSVTFDSGDLVTFTFDATNCVAITTAAMGLNTTSCM